MHKLRIIFFMILATYFSHMAYALPHKTFAQSPTELLFVDVDNDRKLYLVKNNESILVDTNMLGQSEIVSIEYYPHSTDRRFFIFSWLRSQGQGKLFYLNFHNILTECLDEVIDFAVSEKFIAVVKKDFKLFWWDDSFNNLFRFQDEGPQNITGVSRALNANFIFITKEEPKENPLYAVYYLRLTNRSVDWEKLLQVKLTQSIKRFQFTDNSDGFRLFIADNTVYYSGTGNLQKNQAENLRNRISHLDQNGNLYTSDGKVFKLVKVSKFLMDSCQIEEVDTFSFEKVSYMAENIIVQLDGTIWINTETNNTSIQSSDFANWVKKGKTMPLQKPMGSSSEKDDLFDSSIEDLQNPFWFFSKWKS